MTEPQAVVVAETRNHIGHLTLNRPEGLNALTLEMVRLLHKQLKAWASDESIRAVILRGAGERAFCAGGDIRGLYDLHKAGEHGIEEFFRHEYLLDQYIHDYAKPIIVLMDGFVLGGGMGLAQGCGLRLVSERARLGMPETGIGYFPDVGGSYFLPRLPGELGIYLGLTGNHVASAADALYAGLADAHLPSERMAKLDQHFDNLDWSLKTSEQLVRDIAVTELPGSELARLQPAIDHHFAERDIPAIRQSLLEEHRSEFKEWAQATVKTLDQRSPLALAVTLELLRRGRKLDLPECFAMELHLDRQWFEHGDIVEGVRALLVDKDKNPQWNPPSIAQLDPHRVATFFKGL
ncbi:enoyl-CoA hydratase/isomerase family protein [Halopseudomonas sp.]|uniref:enoyl-CoA hydratase/isomerase family protein n=1 Tax=Halopseudomonas sp. TaxID=2901191 RepID=UPI003564E794